MADSQERVKSLEGIYHCKDFSDIASCFAKLHMSLESRLDAKLEPVISKLSKVEKNVESMETFVEYANEEFKTIHEVTIPNLDSKIEDLKNERLKLDIWGRKWNLIVRGVSGSEGYEPSETTDKTLRCFMFEELKIDRSRVNDMTFQAVHRLPGETDEAKNTIVRFNRLIDRDLVLESAMKNLKAGTGISIVPDLPKDVAKKRTELLKERRQLSPDQRRKCKLI